MTGLPPTPQEVDAYLSDTSPNAYEKVVDRLLASPRYGERMAFRWMEVARYADTNGYQTDGVREMWRWRDWVINAFNQNMPYDEFTVEQIAGDLLPNPTPNRTSRPASIATTVPAREGGIVPEEYRVEYVADRAETTSTVWMGLTVGCARCHDHKYDPIPAEGFLSPVRLLQPCSDEHGFAYNYGNDEPNIKAPYPSRKNISPNSIKGSPRSRRRMTRRSRASPSFERCWKPADTPRSSCLPRMALSRPSSLPLLNPSLTSTTSTFHFRRLDQTRVSQPAPSSPTPKTTWKARATALYLIDGKIRLHIILRWTDCAAPRNRSSQCSSTNGSTSSSLTTASAKAAGVCTSTSMASARNQGPFIKTT